VANLARWCYRHRSIVIGLWVVALIAAFGATKAVGTDYSNSFSLPNTDSTKALSLLQSVSPSNTGETDNIVWHVSSGSVLDSSIKQSVTAMLSRVSAIPEVGSVQGPYSPRGAVQISKDHKTAYANITFTKDSHDLDAADVKKVITTAQSADTSNLEVELGGQSIEQSQQAKPSSTEALGVVAAAIILFIAFGSLYATLVPLMTALIALGVGINAIGLLSHAFGISAFSPTLGALIGLGVGIDYALFIITRHTAGIKAGLSPEKAAAIALNTAGRAVLFAGSAVSIALLGLLVLRINFLNGVGIAAAVVVVVTVIAASTLLPALFGVFGMRILSRKQRRALRDKGPQSEEIIKGLWARNAAFVQKRPIMVGLVAVIIIGTLIIPYFSLRLGSSDASNDSTTSTTYKSYELLAHGFGAGSNGPLLLVANVSSSAERSAFVHVANVLKKTPGIAGVETFPLTPTAKVGTMQVIPSTSPESVATSNLITHLRKEVLPIAEANSGLHIYVGGVTATFSDFSSVISSKLPLFLAVVIGFGFLILMVAFRSLVVPLTAALMNVLAAGAAFGVLVAVFQWGWGASLLHTGGPGPVEAFVPVLMLRNGYIPKIMPAQSGLAKLKRGELLRLPLQS
jgi:RND superfamily putative drug exporter